VLPGNLWSICIDELTLTTPKTLNLCIHILLTSWWNSGAIRLSRFNSSWYLFGSLLSQIIQAKEGEALRQTLQTMVLEMSDQIRQGLCYAKWIIKL